MTYDSTLHSLLLNGSININFKFAITEHHRYIQRNAKMNKAYLEIIYSPNCNIQ
jgi:hypothetical protein